MTCRKMRMDGCLLAGGLPCFFFARTGIEKSCAEESTLVIRFDRCSASQ